MKRNWILLLTLSLLLSGCSWANQSFVSVEPHREQRQSQQTDVAEASNYLQLLQALEHIIASGTEVAAVKVPNYPQEGIEHGMNRLMKDRTTFVIAHRLSTVRNANAIMVLEQGEIIERGDHDQLLEMKGRYYELYTGVKELD